MSVCTKKHIQVAIYAKDGGRHVFTQSVAWGRITIDAVVPLLQLVCDNVLAIELSKTPVSCAAGCAHCCYQLIPVSAAEAVFLNGMIQAFPRTRRRKVRRDFKSIQDKVQTRVIEGSAPPLDFDQSYFQMGVPCPFLENNRCGIYQQRPLACREYHVNSPSQHCINPYRTNPRRAVKGLNIAALLSAFCTHLLQSPEKIVPLYAVDKWGDDHPAARTTFDAEWVFTKLMNGVVKGGHANESISRIDWQILETLEEQRLKTPATPGRAIAQCMSNNRDRDEALTQNPRLNYGSVLRPKDPLKLFVQHANSENIRQIILQLMQSDARLKEEHPFVEVGAGDGYLRFLGNLCRDRDVQRFCAQVIETESDEVLVNENKERGKYTLLLKAQDLANRFGEQFTPLVISFNVLDVFSSVTLHEVLMAVSTVLMPEGRVVHIMSSAIHSSIFMDIAERNPGKTLLPFYSGGTIGVVLVDKMRSLPNQVSFFSGRPDLLPLLFKQSPEEYLSFAALIQSWIDESGLPHERVLLHEYSMNKLCAAMQRSGFYVEHSGIVDSTVVVASDDSTKTLGISNTIANRFGVLTVDRDRRVADQQVRESSSFGFIVGRKSRTV